MLTRKASLVLFLVMMTVSGLILSACTTPATPEAIETEVTRIITQIVKETEIVEGTPQVIEREVTKIVEIDKVVTATPEPEALAEQPKVGGKLVVAIQADFPSFDPDVAVAYEDWIVVNQIYNALYQFDKDGNMYPDLAADFPEISEDGLTYVIPIKKGVKFHNGAELTAEDVKYSLERSLIPEVKSWGPRFMNNVAGAQDVLDAKTTDLAGIKVLDEYTVQITLQSPQAVFINNLAVGPSLIVNKAYVEEVGLEEFGRNPVGTGPYKYVEWISGQKLVLAANYDFHGDRGPYIETIEYQIGVDPSLAVLRLEAGEIDLMWDNIPPAEFVSMTTDEKWEGYVTGGLVYYTGWVEMNTRMEPFTDKRVRQAVSMALNRERLVQLTQGSVSSTKSLLPPGTAGYDPDVGWEYDPVAAKELLAEAGYPDGFATELYYRESPIWSLVAQAAQQDLGLVGIDVELRPAAAPAFYALAGSGDMPMGVTGKGANYPDPFDWLSFCTCVQAYEGTRYPGWYCNPELDALVDEAESLAAFPEERVAKYQEVVKILIQDSPRAFLYNSNKYVAHTQELKGFYVHPIYWFWWSDYWLDR